MFHVISSTCSDTTHQQHNHRTRFEVPGGAQPMPVPALVPNHIQEVGGAEAERGWEGFPCNEA